MMIMIIDIISGVLVHASSQCSLLFLLDGQPSLEAVMGSIQSQLERGLREGNKLAAQSAIAHLQVMGLRFPLFVSNVMNYNDRNYEYLNHHWYVNISDPLPY